MGEEKGGREGEEGREGVGERERESEGDSVLGYRNRAHVLPCKVQTVLILGKIT